jgi:hypothetical protein
VAADSPKSGMRCNDGYFYIPSVRLSKAERRAILTCRPPSCFFN